MSKAIIGLTLVVLSTMAVSTELAAQTRDDERAIPAQTDAVAPPAEPRENELIRLPADQPGPEPVARTGFHAYFYSVAHDFGAMPTMKSTYAVLGGVGGLALTVQGQDPTMNAHFQGSNTGFFAAGQHIGQSYTIAAAGFATYVAGRLTKNEKATHIGIDELRALLETELIVQGMKYAIRRERPDGTGYSFPSGHAADSFAAATVLQRHFGAKAAIPTYLLASYIAMSRLHENRHYVSDVIFGAGVGYMVGHTVTRHGKGNFLEFAMYPIVVPGGGGIAFVRVAP